MAITIRFGALPAANVAFAYSPGQEALHSLHVLADSRSHPLHVTWVMNARRQLTPALKAELERFSFLFDHNQLPVLWDVRSSPAIRSFADDLAELRRSSPTEFVAMLRTSAADWDAEATLRADAAAVTAEAEQAPERVLERFCDLLEGYWAACLAPRWAEIEAAFVSDIEQRGRRLLRKGTAGALEALSPDIRVDSAGQTCTVARKVNLEVTLTEADSLTLIPTYFAWPHMFVSTTRPDILMAYPVLEQHAEGRTPVPPERLLTLLRAAGDMSRLQILQLVGGRPRSTGELAGLIGISEAAVSKHLKQLQAAGLVTAERQSYYVFYRAATEPVAEISRGLSALLTGEAE